MAVSLDQFGKALVAAGFATVDEFKSLWASIPAAERPKDAAGLAKLLVAGKKLTPFQAAVLSEGRNVPLTLGDYTVLEEIGAGGMGQVYKARHKRMERVVALKVMSAAAMKDEAAVKRFQREVRAAARLEHPNIVTAYDSGEAGSVKYLVMQFVDGGDLSQLVKKNGPLPIERAVDYVLQAARGLSFAHGEGVIHRDIKPANLLLDRKGIVKILDMGLARIESSDDGLTATEQVMGTVDYMSPEQAANTKGVDGRADIYSLGCTLWFLLTGKKAYEADTMIARLMAHKDAPLPSLVKARDDAPWPLEQAFHRMIAKRPEDRFQSMDEVVAALTPFGSGGSPTAGMGSSIGMGPSVHDAELSAFLKSSGPATKPAAKPAASKTSIETEATAQFVSPEASTDPKSEIGIAPLGVRPAAKPQAKGTVNRDAQRSASGGKPPKKTLLLAGAGGAALLVLLGIWFIFRDKNGNETARVQVPEGGSVTVQPTAATGRGPAPAATPSSTVSFFVEGVTPTGAPSFMSPSSLQRRWPLAASKLEDIQWLLGLGAKVTLRVAMPSIHSSADRTITTTTEIPAGAATIVGVELFDKPAPTTDADMARISSFGDLETLAFADKTKNDVTYQGWGKLTALRNLRSMKVNGYGMNGTLPDFMTSLSALEYLEIPYQNADEWARAAAAAPALKKIHAYRTTLTDDGLARLEKRTSLLEIDLRAAKVTQAGIDRFAAALPQCRIKWGDERNPTVLEPRVPPPSVATPAAAPSPGVPGTPIDLLALCDPTRDAVKGTWKKEGASLQGSGTLKLFTPQPVPEEYDLDAEIGLAKRHSKGIYLGFLTGGRQPTLVMDSDGVWVICNVDGLDYGKLNNPTRVADLPWPVNQRVALKLSVRRDGVRVLLGDKPIIDWRGTPAQFSASPYFTNNAPDSFFIFCGTQYSVHRLTLTPILPAPATGVVYLDDLPESGWHGNGNLGKHGRDRRNADILWRGSKPEHALFPQVDDQTKSSSVTYRLDGGYADFQATVGMINKVGSELTFSVFGDEKKLWQSPPVKERDVGLDVVVDVRGVRELKLTVEAVDPVGSYGAWVNPRLTPAALPSAPAPSPAAVVYLDDLQEKSYFGLRALEKPGRNPSDVATLSKYFPEASPVHALLVHPEEPKFDKQKYPGSPIPLRKHMARLVYDLDGKFAAFRSGFRVRRAGSSVPFMAEVWGDGKRLWESGDLVPLGVAGATADVDVRGVRELTLIVAGDDGKRHALLIEPRLTPAVPAPPGGSPGAKTDGVVYLDDLPELEAVVGYMALGKHGKTKGQPALSWRGSPVAHSLWMRPKSNHVSFVRYRLDGRYARFESDAGQVPETNAPPTSPMTFRVLGDGRELWKSKPIAAKDDFDVVSIDVRGVQELRLETSCAGGEHNCEATWYNPRLTPVAPPPAVSPFDSATALKHQQAWAKHLGEPVETTNSVGMKFVVIPPGEFLMGEKESMEGQVPVTLTKPFRLGIHEVTREQWQAVMGKDTGFYAADRGENSAANNMNQEEAVEFCQKLTERERTAGTLSLDAAYRLPTEAEWEWACRAGTTTAYSFGEDEALLGQYAWFKGSTGGMPYAWPVGRLKPNPWGLYDMYGNVKERCHDGVQAQLTGGVDPQGPSEGKTRMLRGGAFGADAASCRTGFRRLDTTKLGKDTTIGFRVALTRTGSGVPPQAGLSTTDSGTPPSASAPPPAVFPFEAATALKHQEAWAKHLGVPVEFTNAVGMKFRLIPPGEFQMGLGPEFTDEELKRLTGDPAIRRLLPARPAHPVRITRPFYMEVEEVTVGRYRDVVGQLRPEMEQDPNAVLTHGVAWPDTIAFCNRLSEREGKRPAYHIDGDKITPLDDADGYRLPTEAQWEYACRAGTNTLWYFGNDGGGGGRELKNRCAAPNPFGLTGLYGGSSEWCWDASDGKPYATSTPGPQDDPRKDVGNNRIKRGGSNNDGGGGDRVAVNSFARAGGVVSELSQYTGFGRVVLPIALPASSEPHASVSGPAAGPNPPGDSPGAKSTAAATPSTPAEPRTSVSGPASSSTAPTNTPAAPRWPLAPTKPQDIVWLQGLRTTLTLRTGPTTEAVLKSTDAPPAGPATIVGIDFGRDNFSRMTDEVLRRTATLVDLEELKFPYAKPAEQVTKDGLPQLATLVNLRRLNLGRIGPKETDPAFLERFVNLESLHLGSLAFADWELHVARLPALAELRLDKMGDLNLQRLGTMPRLTELGLSDYGAAEGSKRHEAAKQFAPLVPWCRITVFGQGNADERVVIEPTAPPPNTITPTAK
jgi:formylglycine-generating enzyme required for sulfatase activity/serine/threonine protein kinase